MKQHRYRVTVEPLSDEEDLRPSFQEDVLQFDFGTHDDLFSIVERLRNRGDFPAETAAVFGVGLKLFSEVLLKHKDHALFQDFRPHFAQFMKALKKGSATG
jgi:hypothetical protein